MQSVAYLNFNGQCREAMEFYAKTLGGQVVAMFTHGETPAAEHCAANMQDLIMHARVVAGSAVLMASDAPPEMYTRPAGIWVSLHPDSAEDADRIFHALAEGGDVVMPIQQTFWAERFGMVTDRFGIPWMVNFEKTA